MTRLVLLCQCATSERDFWCRIAALVILLGVEGPGVEA